MKLYESIKPLKEETYLHINNGGVTVGMEYDPSGLKCLKISATHMAAKTNEMRIPITRDALRTIILDLVDELEDWSGKDQSFDLAANGSSRTVYGSLAKQVQYIIGSSAQSESMSDSSHEII